MEKRRIPGTHIDVSVVGLGCNQFGWSVDPAGAKEIVDVALDAGITYFDTAETYGDGESERSLGAALRGRREQVVIGTKFGWGKGGKDNEIARGARPYIREAVERSLRALETDYIDLYMYHRHDTITPIEETLAALTELVQEGKVLHIGCANFSGVRIEEADGLARAGGLSRFVTVQNEWSLLERRIEEKVVPACERCEVGIIPYFPLARGLLTGKYRRGEPSPGGRIADTSTIEDETWDRVEALEALASEWGVSMLELAIGGLAAEPQVVTVITGARTPEQVVANVAAGVWEPSAGELAALRAV